MRKVGGWRDGNEIQLGPEEPYKEWLHDNESEGHPGSEDEEEEEEDRVESGEDGYGPDEAGSRATGSRELSHDSAFDRDESPEDPGEDTSSNVSEDSEDSEDAEAMEAAEDFWYCYGHFPANNVDPRAYKPFSWDERERRYGPTGHCGLAIVDYSKIPNVAPAWV